MLLKCHTNNFIKGSRNQFNPPNHFVIGNLAYQHRRDVVFKFQFCRYSFVLAAGSGSKIPIITSLEDQLHQYKISGSLY
jgi:hypothetical protein